MKFLEKDLEDIIYNTDPDELRKRGLFVHGKLFRQLNIGKYGIADIVCVERVGRELIINVLELKKEKIDVFSFLQALRYLKGISRYIKDYRGIECDITFQITLIGKTIDLSNDFVYLSGFDIYTSDQESSFLNICTYDYDFDGIKFNPVNDYSLKDEGFGKNNIF
jgi:hypothetical protein